MIKSKILQIAKQDLKLNLRNKWILGISILFGILTLSIAYSGMVTSGYIGFQDFRRTGASIISLVLYLVPILALMMGTYTFVSYKDYIDWIVTQPIARWKIIMGKYIGALVTLIISTASGFSIAGIVIAIQIGVEGSLRFMLVVLLALLLGAVFLSIAFLLTIIVKRRQSAVGLSILVWFFFVIFYDLLMMSSTLYLSHSTLKSSLLFGLLFNPVDMIRATSLIVVGGESIFGAAGVVAVKQFGDIGTLVVLSLVIISVWTLLPLLISIKLFNRQDL
ncbi:MAG: ABC transporter permease subunit [candidate division Zixibacteria bacterium]|nr:ABC transporter permease subunit [candidate division Zixibacteria bacterium]